MEFILINQFGFFFQTNVVLKFSSHVFLGSVSIEVLFLHQMDSVTKLYLLVEDINVSKKWEINLQYICFNDS